MNSRKFHVQTKDNETVHYTKPGKKMTVKEFWEWLDDMDTNGDGVISSTELEGALKSIGMKFVTSWKTQQAMAAADINGDGIINSGLELVIDYVQKHRGAHHRPGRR